MGILVDHICQIPEYLNTPVIGVRHINLVTPINAYPGRQPELARSSAAPAQNQLQGTTPVKYLHGIHQGVTDINVAVTVNGYSLGPAEITLGIARRTKLAHHHPFRGQNRNPEIEGIGHIYLAPAVDSNVGWTIEAGPAVAKSPQTPPFNAVPVEYDNLAGQGIRYINILVEGVKSDAGRPAEPFPQKWSQGGVLRIEAIHHSGHRIGYVDETVIIYRQTDGAAQRRLLRAGDKRIPSPGNVEAVHHAPSRIGQIEFVFGTEHTMGTTNGTALLTAYHLQQTSPESFAPQVGGTGNVLDPYDPVLGGGHRP